MAEVTIEALQKGVAQVEGYVSSYTKMEGTLEVEISLLEKRHSLLTQAMAALQHLIDQEISMSVSSLEELLTGALRAVFDDQVLTVKAEPEISRGKVAIELVTTQEKDGKSVSGPALDTFGGSISSLQSLLLRVLLIQKRKLRPLLVVDEVFAAFDANYTPIWRLFLTPWQKLDFNILGVTHNIPMYEAASRVYKVIPKGDHSEVIKVKG